MTRLGACQLLIANPRDLKAFVRTLQTRPFTLMSGVNTLYNALAHQSGIDRGRTSPTWCCASPAGWRPRPPSPSGGRS